MCRYGYLSDVNVNIAVLPIESRLWLVVFEIGCHRELVGPSE